MLGIEGFGGRYVSCLCRMGEGKGWTMQCWYVGGGFCLNCNGKWIDMPGIVGCNGQDLVVV